MCILHLSKIDVIHKGLENPECCHKDGILTEKVSALMFLFLACLIWQAVCDIISLEMRSK